MAAGSRAPGGSVMSSLSSPEGAVVQNLLSCFIHGRVKISQTAQRVGAEERAPCTPPELAENPVTDFTVGFESRIGGEAEIRLRVELMTCLHCQLSCLLFSLFTLNSPVISSLTMFWCA